jgi:hypothetical protein
MPSDVLQALASRVSTMTIKLSRKMVLLPNLGLTDTPRLVRVGVLRVLICGRRVGSIDGSILRH